jgi:hypothetical protein
MPGLLEDFNNMTEVVAVAAKSAALVTGNPIVSAVSHVFDGVHAAGRILQGISQELESKESVKGAQADINDKPSLSASMNFTAGRS